MEKDKVLNQISQAQLDLNQQEGKLRGLEDIIQKLQNEVDNQKADKKKKLEDKDREITHLKEIVDEKKRDIEKLKSSVESHLGRLKEVEKIIPKKPEAEYI